MGLGYFFVGVLKGGDVGREGGWGGRAGGDVQQRVLCERCQRLRVGGFGVVVGQCLLGGGYVGTFGEERVDA